MKPKDNPAYGDNQSTISKDGTSISYSKTGDGELFIGIFGAICHKDFFPVKGDVKELSKYYSVINYDRRGRGGSLMHTSWSIQKEVEDIESLIDENGGSAYLYGHSSGAVLALEASLALSEKIKGVVVYDASYVSTDEEYTEYQNTKESVKNLLKQDNYSKALKYFLTEIGMPKAFIFLLKLMPGWKTMKRLAPTLMYDIALTENLPPIKRLHNISVPVLLLAGDKNPDSIKNVYKQLADNIPNNQHYLLEGMDHMASMKSLIPYIQKFLN